MSLSLDLSISSLTPLFVLQNTDELYAMKVMTKKDMIDRKKVRVTTASESVFV